MVWHLDEPVGDSAALNTWLICKQAREMGIRVLLSGMGADELLGGYRKQLATVLVAKYQQIPGFLRSRVIEPLAFRLPVAVGSRGIRPVRWAQRFLKGARMSPLDAFSYGMAYLPERELRELAERFGYRKSELRDLYPIQAFGEMAQRVKDLPLIQQLTYLDTKLFLPGLNLLYTDKASMAASVEVRPPFLDLDLVRFCARLSPELKIKGRTQKYLLKKVALRYLPRSVVYRSKSSFTTPLRPWFQSELGLSLQSKFENNAALSSLIPKEIVLRLLKAHQRGEADHAQALWGFWTAAHWFEQQSDPSSVRSSTMDFLESNRHF